MTTSFLPTSSRFRATEDGDCSTTTRLVVPGVLNSQLAGQTYDAFHIDASRQLEDPVKAGLVENTADWRWSSARHSELGRTVGVPITWGE